tara:strand:- start:26 stop:181 length:156 start_codon:yes stop_codon:yes gene_type:complete
MEYFLNLHLHHLQTLNQVLKMHLLEYLLVLHFVFLVLLVHLLLLQLDNFVL